MSVLLLSIEEHLIDHPDGFQYVLITSYDGESGKCKYAARNCETYHTIYQNTDEMAHNRFMKCNDKYYILEDGKLVRYDMSVKIQMAREWILSIAEQMIGLRCISYESSCECRDEKEQIFLFHEEKGLLDIGCNYALTVLALIFIIKNGVLFSIKNDIADNVFLEIYDNCQSTVMEIEQWINSSRNTD